MRPGNLPAHIIIQSEAISSKGEEDSAYFCHRNATRRTQEELRTHFGLQPSQLHANRCLCTPQLVGGPADGAAIGNRHKGTREADIYIGDIIYVSGPTPEIGENIFNRDCDVEAACVPSWNSVLSG
jgi:hypothetical protein